MYRIDLVRTPKPKPVIQSWQGVQHRFSQATGLVNRQLSQVYRRLHNKGYDLVGITEWRDLDSFRESQEYRLPNPLNPTTDPEVNLYEVINQADRETPESGDLIVTNPYRIPASEADDNARMWNDSKDHMFDQPGFVCARLYRQMNDQCDYYYVSQARWRSETDFMKQFEGKDFRKIIAAFEGKFSICFSSQVQPHPATTKEALV